MNPEERAYMEQQQRETQLAQASLQQNQINQMNQSLIAQEQERSMVKDQLDLNEELETIHNLLRGNIKIKDDNGTRWVAPTDSEMIILSNYGIHLIMNTITFYINKNTLLSNYDEQTILGKMEDFSTDLTDTIFIEYEKVFQYPSFEDCKKVLLERIERKKELRKFAIEILGKKINQEDEDEIEKEIIQEMEGKIDREIQKIKEQIIKNKIKRFMILIREVQDAVHSTYLRAWKGQERITLRQHINISETHGTGNNLSQPSKINPLNWVRGG